MICFQIVFFDRLHTDQYRASATGAGLWFAFRLCSLIDCIQRHLFVRDRLLVVICFQIVFFDRLHTETAKNGSLLHGLWFAFRLCSLIDCIQMFYSMKNHKSVVICFQIVFFDRLHTEDTASAVDWTGLWFAFRLCSLIDCIQRLTGNLSGLICCDLLSDCVLW